MIKLRRLKIHRFRHVRAGSELRFDDGVNLVLGANATGKTLLLGLIASVVGLDFSAFADETFSLEFELAIDDGYTLEMSVHSEGGPPPPPTGDPRKTPQSERSYQYVATVRRLVDGLSCVITGTPEMTRIQASTWGERAKGGPACSPLRPGFLRGALQNGPTEILLGTWNFFSAPKVVRFDEALGCFAAMTGVAPPADAIAAAPAAESAFTYHLRGAVMEGFTPGTRNFVPGDSIEHAIVSAHRDGGGLVAITEHEGDAHEHALRGVSTFLPQVLKILGWSRAAIRPEVQSYRHDKAKKQHHYSVRGFTFYFDSPGGTTLHHDHLSYGQKRLLAYFYYLATSPDFVIADDLTHGLHRRWISACMQAIGPRQAFVTSQNPLLFDCVEFASAAEVETRFVTCKHELVDGVERLVWDNLSRDQAAGLFSAYQLRIEPVGEILVTRGLW